VPRPNRIRELREAKGLSQEEVARAAGISLGGFRLIENGQTGNPGFYNALRIAKALEVDVSDLFNEEVPA
jgi:transcriptional regulator with XRE-family HTH domain